MKQTAYFVLELLCALAIAAIIYAIAIPGLSRHIHKVYALLTMHQIQHAIHYGRSLAIVHDKPVRICPSQDKLHCGGEWQHGILVISPNGKPCFFKVYCALHCELSLSQSGFTTQTIAIEANGMTYQNGSFQYKSLKFTDFPQFKLYFNKALRTYALSHLNLG